MYNMVGYCYWLPWRTENLSKQRMDIKRVMMPHIGNKDKDRGF